MKQETILSVDVYWKRIGIDAAELKSSTGFTLVEVWRDRRKNCWIGIAVSGMCNPNINSLDDAIAWANARFGINARIIDPPAAGEG